MIFKEFNSPPLLSLMNVVWKVWWCRWLSGHLAILTSSLWKSDGLSLTCRVYGCWHLSQPSGWIKHAEYSHCKETKIHDKSRTQSKALSVMITIVFGVFRDMKYSSNLPFPDCAFKKRTGRRTEIITAALSLYYPLVLVWRGKWIPKCGISRSWLKGQGRDHLLFIGLRALLNTQFILSGIYGKQTTPRTNDSKTL